jgi:hypothetical protein
MLKYFLLTLLLVATGHMHASSTAPTLLAIPTTAADALRQINSIDVAIMQLKSATREAQLKLLTAARNKCVDAIRGGVSRTTIREYQVDCNKALTVDKLPEIPTVPTAPTPTVIPTDTAKLIEMVVQTPAEMYDKLQALKKILNNRNIMRTDQGATVNKAINSLIKEISTEVLTPAEAASQYTQIRAAREDFINSTRSTKKSAPAARPVAGMGVGVGASVTAPRPGGVVAASPATGMGVEAVVTGEIEDDDYADDRFETDTDEEEDYEQGDDQFDSESPAATPVASARTSNLPIIAPGGPFGKKQVDRSTTDERGFTVNRRELTTGADLVTGSMTANQPKMIQVKPSESTITYVADDAKDPAAGAGSGSRTEVGVGAGSGPVYQRIQSAITIAKNGLAQGKQDQLFDSNAFDLINAVTAAAEEALACIRLNTYSAKLSSEIAKIIRLTDTLKKLTVGNLGETKNVSQDYQNNMRIALAAAERELAAAERAMPRPPAAADALANASRASAGATGSRAGAGAGVGAGTGSGGVEGPQAEAVRIFNENKEKLTTVRQKILITAETTKPVIEEEDKGTINSYIQNVTDLAKSNPEALRARELTTGAIALLARHALLYSALLTVKTGTFKRILSERIVEIEQTIEKITNPRDYQTPEARNREMTGYIDTTDGADYLKNTLIATGTFPNQVLYKLVFSPTAATSTPSRPVSATSTSASSIVAQSPAIAPVATAASRPASPVAAFPIRTSVAQTGANLKIQPSSFKASNQTRLATIQENDVEDEESDSEAPSPTASPVGIDRNARTSGVEESKDAVATAGAAAGAGSGTTASTVRTGLATLVENSIGALKNGTGSFENKELVAIKTKNTATLTEAQLLTLWLCGIYHASKIKTESRTSRGVISQSYPTLDSLSFHLAIMHSLFYVKQQNTAFTPSGTLADVLSKVAPSMKEENARITLEQTPVAQFLTANGQFKTQYVDKQTNKINWSEDDKNLCSLIHALWQAKASLSSATLGIISTCLISLGLSAPAATRLAVVPSPAPRPVSTPVDTAGGARAATGVAAGAGGSTPATPAVQPPAVVPSPSGQPAPRPVSTAVGAATQMLQPRAGTTQTGAGQTTPVLAPTPPSNPMGTPVGTAAGASKSATPAVQPPAVVPSSSTPPATRPVSTSVDTAAGAGGATGVATGVAAGAAAGAGSGAGASTAGATIDWATLPSRAKMILIQSEGANLYFQLIKNPATATFFSLDANVFPSKTLTDSLQKPSTDDAKTTLLIDAFFKFATIAVDKTRTAAGLWNSGSRTAGVADAADQAACLAIMMKLAQIAENVSATDENRALRNQPAETLSLMLNESRPENNVPRLKGFWDNYMFGRGAIISKSAQFRLQIVDVWVNKNTRANGPVRDEIDDLAAKLERSKEYTPK